MRIEIITGLCATLAFGACTAPSRWPGPPPASPSSSPIITSAAPDRIDDVDAAIPRFGNTNFKPPPVEPLPVDPSAPDLQPEEPTVEKKYANP